VSEGLVKRRQLDGHRNAATAGIPAAYSQFAGDDVGQKDCSGLSGGRMAIAPSVQEFLRLANIAYAVLPHPAAFSAREEAAATHVPDCDWAKTVVCFADGEPLQAVVPADLEVDLPSLAMLVRASTVRLATEDELRWLYPECDRGAVPPLGPLYRHRIAVDSTLATEPRIVFNGGTHHDAIAMRYGDFARIVRPIVGSFARYPISRRQPAQCW
jgi:Ala-tRNA(Pro) deacylase